MASMPTPGQTCDSIIVLTACYHHTRVYHLTGSVGVGDSADALVLQQDLHDKMSLNLTKLMNYVRNDYHTKEN